MKSYQSVVALLGGATLMVLGSIIGLQNPAVLLGCSWGRVASNTNY